METRSRFIQDVLAITIGVVLAEILIQLFVTPTIAQRGDHKPSAPANPLAALLG